MSVQLEWRKSLQEGDEVIVSRRGSIELLTVDRVTKTQVFFGANKFSKKTGRLLGSSEWSLTKIFKPTPILRDMAFREKLLKFLVGVQWDSLTTEVLEDVTKTIKRERNRGLK